MLDFTEQEVSITSQPELSVDTPTVSDNLPGTDGPTAEETRWALEHMTDSLANPELTAATIAKLHPYRTFVQDEDETEEV